MDIKDLKKLLAGVGIASLLTGLPLTSGTAIGGSGSGWSAKDDSAVSAEKVEKDTGGSGWSADKKGAVSTEEEKEHAEEKAEEEKAKKAGGSGWSGSK